MASIYACVFEMGFVEESIVLQYFYYDKTNFNYFSFMDWRLRYDAIIIATVA